MCKASTIYIERDISPAAHPGQSQSGPIHPSLQMHSNGSFWQVP